MSPDGRAGIDASLVRRLVAEQMPQWAGLPVVPVEEDGHDNRTYRLGDSLSVRLPIGEGYVAAVAKEDRWLPHLAPQLPLPIPEPVAVGRPGEGYPYPWSVRRWLPGSSLRRELVSDEPELADSLAGFLHALAEADATDGPAAGEHSHFRGCPPAHYDDQTRSALDALGPRIDVGTATRVWSEALDAGSTGRPVWFHGDVAAGNLLVRDGRLSAVIDFGTSGVGDPACDLVIAWTYFHGAARARFRAAMDADEGTWARARGWCLWKTLITMAGRDEADPALTTLLEDLLVD